MKFNPKHLIKIPATVAFLIPPGIFIAYCAIKDWTPTDLGLMIFGLLGGLMLILYMMFAAKPENKMQYMCATIGLCLVTMSSMSLVLGIILVVTPLSFEGGRLLWKLSKPATAKHLITGTTPTPAP